MPVSTGEVEHLSVAAGSANCYLHYGNKCGFLQKQRIDLPQDTGIVLLVGINPKDSIPYFLLIHGHWNSILMLLSIALQLRFWILFRRRVRNITSVTDGEWLQERSIFQTEGDW